MGSQLYGKVTADSCACLKVMAMVCDLVPHIVFGAANPISASFMKAIQGKEIDVCLIHHVERKWLRHNSLPLFIYVHSQNTLMERLLHFTKYDMAEADFVALLESRGLVISDEAKAVRYLESIGYYRLSPYMYPFLMFVSLSS